MRRGFRRRPAACLDRNPSGGVRAADETRGAALPVRLDAEAEQEAGREILRRLGVATRRGVAGGSSAGRFVGPSFHVFVDGLDSTLTAVFGNRVVYLLQ